MSARVFLIGLDGMDCGLVRRLMASGRMPALASLEQRGVRLELGNPMGTLPGVLWNEIIMGQSAQQVPYYYYPKQLRTGEAVGRPITADEVDPGAFFWRPLVQAGKRVAILDVPYMVLDPEINGIQVTEWGMHDPEFGFASVPADLAPQIAERYGMHPVSQKHSGRCDRYPKTHQGYLSLLEDLLEGLNRRTRLYGDLLRQEQWDLFFGAYSEAHCAGHHLFHFHDATHHHHDADAPQRLKDGLAEIYSAIDRSIGTLLEMAGDDAQVLVFCPQGMTQFTGGQQLVPEVLTRLGLASDGGAARDSLIRKLNQFVKHNAPKSLTPLLRSVARLGPVHALQEQAGCLLDPFTSAGTKAAAVANNRIVAIRLNLKGREPHGAVAPGAEAESVLALIREALTELRHPETGETLVKHCMPITEIYGPEPHPDLPDLLVEFRTDLGLIEAGVSERLGLVHVPIGTFFNSRTGDHTTDGMLWARAPGLPEGRTLDPANTLDIGPTVLALFGQPIPNRMDGRAIAHLIEPIRSAAE